MKFDYRKFMNEVVDWIELKKTLLNDMDLVRSSILIGYSNRAESYVINMRTIHSLSDK